MENDLNPDVSTSLNQCANFNDAIDGLMYIRISDLPESTIKPVLEEMSEQLKEN